MPSKQASLSPRGRGPLGGGAHGARNYSEVDKCERCEGLWFDNGEAEQLKSDWMADFLDSGDPAVGRTYNAVRDIQCPRCGDPMKKINDAKQSHIEYEACAAHGVFMDAGEIVETAAPEPFFERPENERTQDFLRRILRH